MKYNTFYEDPSKLHIVTNYSDDKLLYHNGSIPVNKLFYLQ